MTPSKEHFATLFTEALYSIRALTSQNISEIEKDLAKVISTTFETIEKWRRIGGKQRNLMPNLQQAEGVAKWLVDNGGLLGREQFEEFLGSAGHPYPDQAWIRSFPRIEGPEPVEHFTGREDELKELMTVLQPGELVTLCGPAGIGKTALVAQAIKRLAQDHKPPKQFPDGIFYHNFYGQPSVDVVLEKIAQAFNTKPHFPFLEAAQQALFNYHALLILDGAEEAEPDELNRILNTRRRWGILVVTREKRIARRKVLLLDVLPLEQSIHVLQAWSTDAHDQSEFRIWDKNQRSGYAAAKEICEVLGQLPLALRLAGSYMAETSTTLSELLMILKTEPLSLSLLQDENLPEEHQHRSVPILLKKILQRVSENAYKVMAIIGLLSYIPFHIDAVASALEISPTLVLSTLGELVRFGLIKRNSTHRYRVIHRLIHIYAQKHVFKLEATVGKLETYYIRLVEEQSNLGGQRYTRLKLELVHLMAILVQCVELRRWQSVLNLVEVIAPCLEKYTNSPAEYIAINEAGLKAAQALGDQQKEYSFLFNLALLHERQDQTQQAINYHQQA